MTTLSWPVRDAPITHEMWRDEFFGLDGISGDTGGDAFHLTRPGTGDTATLTAGGVYRLRGFVLQVTADHGVSLPAVAAGGTAKTYVIAVKYDPAAEAAASGPLSIIAAVKGSFSPSGGTAYAALYEVTRGPAQVLSAATVVDQRTWAAASYYGSPGADSLLYPVGARLVLASGEEMIRVPKVVGGVITGTKWRGLNTPDWQPLPTAGGLVAYQTDPEYARVGGEVILRGGVQRSNGNDLAAANATMTIGVLPVGNRPSDVLRIAAGTSFAGSSNGGRLSVESNGQVSFSPISTGCKWTTLDGLRFFPTY